MSLSPRAPRRPLRRARRLLLGLLAAALLSLGAVAVASSPASASYLGSYAAVPVGYWGPPFGNSVYRMRLESNPWVPSGGWETQKALVRDCQEWSTLDEVNYIVVFDPDWPLAVHVLGVDRYFVCQSWDPQ